MPDYTIPMSAPAMQIPQQRNTPVDPNIAMNVKPFQGPDVAQNTMDVYAMQEAKGRMEDQQQTRRDEANDRAVLEIAKASGHNLYTVDGVQGILENFGDKLSPKAIQGLSKHVQGLIESSTKIQEHLTKIDDRQFALAQRTTEETLKDMTHPLDVYNAALKSGVAPDQALKVFKASANAVVEMYRGRNGADGKPLLDEKKLQEMSNFTPDQWADKVQHAAFTQNEIKVAADARAKLSKSNLEEAQADAIRSGKDKKGANHFTQEKVMYKGKEEFAQHNAADGTYTIRGKVIGNNDPDYPVPIDKNATGAGLGSREGVFLKRVLGAAIQSTGELENITKLPMTITSGWMGGTSQGPGMLEAGKSVLINKLRAEDTQAYEALSTGLSRVLAAVETAGLAPSGALTHQMDKLTIKEGDTGNTALLKLAQTRQIVESGLATPMADPKVPPEIKSLMQATIDRLHKAVPFTVPDVIALQHAKSSKKTLSDVMREKQATTGPVGGTVPPEKQAQAEAIMGDPDLSDEEKKSALKALGLQLKGAK